MVDVEGIMRKLNIGLVLLLVVLCIVFIFAIERRKHTMTGGPCYDERA